MNARLPHRPPAWARRLAAAIVARRDRAFLVDDLDDEFAARRAQGRRALPWYFAQAIHAALTRRGAINRNRQTPSGRGASMRSMFTDLRIAARNCRRQPGLTASIVLSLGLGIGSATAIFSITQAVLLAPLPYREPDRLVTVWSTLNAADRTWVASADVRDLRSNTRFADGIAMWTWDRVTLTGAGDAASVTAGIVTANTFDVLGASPMLGRLFTESEAIAATRSGRTMFAVLSYDLWRGRFASDPAIAGRTITVNDEPVTILGVMPPQFRLPTDFGRGAAAPTELWTPIDNDPARNERGNSYFAAARLRAGVAPASFDTELAAMAADFVRLGRYPTAARFNLFSQTIDDDVLGGVRPVFRVLIAAVSVLFLIACANAAALLVARGEARRREWATRAALGSGRWRLLRLQLAEGALLSLAGGTIGIGVAILAVRTLALIGTTAIPRAGDVSIDWRVIAVMLALSAVATVLSSVAPAAHAIRLNVLEGLSAGGRTASPSRGRRRVRALLVVTQLSLGLLLLTGAGLLGRSLLALRSVDLGFDPDRVLTARVALPAGRYSRPGQADAYFDALTAGLRALPGVDSAGLVRVLPLAQTIGYWPVTVEGYEPPPGQRPRGDWQIATPGALEALGERLVRGRSFTKDDSSTAPVVALVNEAMVRAYWPGRDPIGRRLRFSNDEPLVWGTVVGVVADVRHNGVTSPVAPKFYLPYAQFSAATGDTPVTAGTIVLRTAGDPRSQVAAVRTAAAALDKTVPISAIRPMSDVIDAALTAPRLISILVTAFAAIALLLSALGLFGLVAYLVSERTKEIGIRIAVGASAREIARMVVTQGLRVAGAGVAAGLLASAAVTRGLSSYLYGVGPWDPVTWLLAPAVLIAVALVASVVPALRAAAINPVRALR